MNKTKAILMIAGLLGLLALYLGRGRESTVHNPIKPITTQTSGNVDLLASLSGSHLLQGSDGEVYLDISMHARNAGKAKVVPINMALVIDRSGSMAGDKLTHAKEAAQKLVESLRDGDRLALITYGSDVTLLASATTIDDRSRKELQSAIETIVDRGGTFLSGGFEAGRDEVLRPGASGYVNRVILISDGQANEGTTDMQALTRLAAAAQERGVHLTTMGVGLDFNEDLMTAMAEHGGGHYYFIENSEALASIFEKELQTLTTTVASKATLTLTLKPGVSLAQLYGYAYEQQGQKVTVKLPDLFGGQKRKLICKLKVPADRLGSLDVASVELAFDDMDSGSSAQLLADARVEVTSDAEQVKAGQNREVLAKVEQANVSLRLKRAMDAYESGNVAQARADLEEQIESTTTLNAVLKNSDLDVIVGKMRKQLKAAEAPPASSAGRSLRKEALYDAYQIAK